jgi:hypothetical protein
MKKDHLKFISRDGKLYLPKFDRQDPANKLHVRQIDTDRSRALLIRVCKLEGWDRLQWGVPDRDIWTAKVRTMSGEIRLVKGKVRAPRYTTNMPDTIHRVSAVERHICEAVFAGFGADLIIAHGDRTLWFPLVDYRVREDGRRVAVVTYPDNARPMGRFKDDRGDPKDAEELNFQFLCRHNPAGSHLGWRKSWPISSAEFYDLGEDVA